MFKVVQNIRRISVCPTLLLPILLLLVLLLPILAVLVLVLPILALLVPPPILIPPNRF